MKKLFKLLLTALVVMSLSACSTGGSSNDDVLKIGMLGPLEGEYAVYGTAVKNGAQMAIDDFNAKGKLLDKTVELVAYDTKGDSTEAVNAFNKLVDQDKITALVGATLSGESVAVATSSQSVGIPMISASATVEDFTLVGPNVFRGCYTDPYQAKVLAEFVYNTMGIKDVAIMFNSGSDYSLGLTATFKEVFESLGGKIVASEGYPDKEKDFNTLLTKIKATNPGALFLPDYYQTIALAAVQARAQGIDVPLLGGDGWDGVLSLQGVDTTALEGSVFINHYSPDQAGISDFEAAYKAKYNADPNAFSYLAYDATSVMLQAIADANTTDYQAVIDQLNKIDYNGLLGNMKFDSNGDPIKDVGYIQIVNGAYTTFKK